MTTEPEENKSLPPSPPPSITRMRMGNGKILLVDESSKMKENADISSQPVQSNTNISQDWKSMFPGITFRGLPKPRFVPDFVP
jgi:hypothetical protein